LVADLRKSGKETGYPLMGEIAARILDLVGIVANKNTIPGDLSAADARGIRLGTTWVTQRGMGREHMERIAEIIQRVLSQIHPFTYQGVSNILSRGKIPIDLLEEAKRDVQQLLETLDPDLPSWGYPNDHSLFPENPPVSGLALSSGVGEDVRPDEGECCVIDRTDMGVLEVRGERAWAFLQEVCTKDLTELKPGEGVEAFLLDFEAALLDKTMILRAEPEAFFVLTHPSKVHKVRSWFRRISEGYVLFDPEDILIKVQGPTRVTDRNDPGAPAESRLVPVFLEGQKTEEVMGDEPGIRVFRMCDQKRRVLLMDGATAITKWDRWSHNGNLHCIAREPAQEQSDTHEVSQDETKDQGGAMTLLKSSPELFDLQKPYFVGLWSLREAEPPASFAAFEPPAPPENVRRSCLYHEHAGRAKKIAAFAGWEMPIWYSSIQDEHRSVRGTAGLFDVSHMGVFGVRGEDAAHFLDLISTNYVRWLRVGESQYGYLLDAEDGILDDFMLYRVGYRNYLLVVNAANAEKDLAWLHAVAQGRVSLDAMRPALRFRGDVSVHDLKDPAAGEEALVNVALQGPVSLKTLLKLTSATEDQWRLKSLKKTEVARATLGDAPAWVARTGYTGETMGFELLIHPDKASRLWRNILDAGEDLGVVPVGLGARDSLRTEAGLPLYGHELHGPHCIDPIEAGFEGYVKLHKPFFVGRKRMLERSRNIQRRIIRFRLLHKGSRMLHPGDLVLHRRNQKIIGWVTSSAPDGEGVQVGMALVEARYTRFDTSIAVIPQSDKIPSELGEIAVGKSWPLHEEGVILTRFPEKD
jgi:glycine cleavage system T protein